MIEELGDSRTLEANQLPAGHRSLAYERVHPSGAKLERRN